MFRGQNVAPRLCLRRFASIAVPNIRRFK